MSSRINSKSTALRRVGALATRSLAAGVAAVLAACSSAPGGDLPAAGAPAAEVAVATAVVRDVPLTRRYPGHVEAVERVELRARVSGYIDAIEFEEGAFVKRGSLLVRVDARPYAAAVAEAEAALARATAEARLADKEWHRAVRLVERQAISAEEAERRAAEAAVAEAASAAAAAALERARLDLEHTQIRAPIDGRIGRAEVTAGNLVDDSDRLAVLVSSDTVYVRFDVEEATLAGSNPRDWHARFTLPESPEHAYEGPLAFLDNEVAAGTGTIRARVTIAQPDANLLPGRYGHVDLVVGDRDDALLVDEKALGADQGSRYLLVVGANDTLEYRPVGIGPRIGPYRVIESGLSPEDRVVVNGLMRVRPGMPVRARDMPMAVAAGEVDPPEPRIAQAGDAS